MKKIIIILIGILIAAGCCKDDDSNSSKIDCERLSISIIDKEYTYAKNVIDPICQELPAKPTEDDYYGHGINLEKLIDKLNSNCEDLDFELIVYPGCKLPKAYVAVKTKSETGSFSLEVTGKYMKLITK